MNTYFLKNLAKHIVSEETVNKVEARKIVQLLSAKNLRKLTQLIILEQERKTAYITTADDITAKEKASLQSLFSGKKIVSITDKKIGAGVKAQVYDMIYDLSVKSKAENIARELEEEM